MKTLVTGATGLIGSSLVRELLKDGIYVKALIERTSDTRNIDGLDLERVYGDIRDSESMKLALKDCNTLYQTAGLCRMWVPNNKAFYEVNVEGTKTALNAAMEQGLEKVVYTSSAFTFGAHGVDNPINEKAEFNLWNIKDHYSRSKYMAEVEALKICQKGLPLVIVNPTIVIGPRDSGPSSGVTILNVLNKKSRGYIDTANNYIYVEDVARGHILAAQKGRIGEKYILGNENLTLRDLRKLVEDVSGIRAPDVRIPYPVALVMAYISQFISGINKKPPIVTPSLVIVGRKYGYIDSSKAVNELGLPQTPVKKAVEEAVRWYKENGYVKKK